MTSNKPTIGLDLDGVLYDFLGALLLHLKDQWEIDIQRKDVLDANLIYLTEDDEIRKDILQCIQSPAFYANNVKPYPGAMEAIHRLGEKFRLVAVTGRPIATRGCTLAAVTRDFPCINDLFVSKTKFQVIKAEGCKAFVDDSATIATLLVSKKIKTFLVRYPDHNYARSIPRSRFLTTVGSMSEAADEIIKRFSARVEET